MWERRNIFNGSDCDPGSLQSRDGTLTSGSRSLDFDFHFPNAEFGRTFGTRFGSPLGRKGRALAASLESGCPGRCPTQHFTIRIGNRHNRVVERRFDMRDRARDVATDSFLL